MSIYKQQLTSRHLSENLKPRDDNAVDALADVLRANHQYLYRCSYVPVEAGSVVIQFTKTPMRDLSDGRIWDGNGKQWGTINYETGEIRLKQGATKGKLPIGVSYNYSG